MNANTETTIALPTRRARRAPGRPDPRPASCRPGDRQRPGCRAASACRRPSCDQARAPRSEPAEQPAADRRTAGAALESRWSPGANRSRPPITAGPPAVPDDRPAPAKPSPNPRQEDEWSPGRMRGVTRPGWGGRFAAKMRGESGMSTAEYAVGTLAAVAFAGVLLKVVTSGPVQSALSALIEKALG
ncbi:DUF4244 domain-containing protein [Glycomyces sp. A-F 0318]|nr:DUF4244 domain-containing protein [Glycomyces amatae]MCD0443510.1 DUF4244 domain-containing protein [Glycomyces amatae]